MKGFLRSVVYHVFALWLTSALVPGISISGNVWGMLSAGCALAIMMMLLKPLVSLIFLPINMLTLGLLSWFVNVIVLYLWTVFVPNVSLSPWTFPGFSGAGFTLPSVALNFLWTLILVSLLVSSIVALLEQLGDR